MTLFQLLRKVLDASKGGVTVDEALELLDEAIHLIRELRKSDPVLAELDPTALDDEDVEAILEEYGVVTAASDDSEALPPGLALKLIKWAVRALLVLV